MNTNQKRQALLTISDNPAWHEKVKKMADNQVVAIYLRLKSQNKL